MDLNKLKIFINLYETRNYTRTANMLNLTQPAISYSIKAIEDEVGQRLFVRDKRHVTPTESARIFYRQVRPLVNTYYTAVQSIKKDQDELDKKINIGYGYTPFNQKYLPRWIKGFHEQFPDSNITVTELNHNDQKQYLKSRNIDLFLTSAGDAAGLPDTEFYPIKSDSFSAIVPKRISLSHKTQLSINEFSNQKIIFIDENWTGIEMINLQRDIAMQNKNVEITYTNTVSGASLLVNSLKGITLGVNFIYLYNNPELKYIPIVGAKSIDYGIVTNSINVKPIVKEFIKYVKMQCN